MKRLNSADSAALAGQWERDCVVCRLTPTDSPNEVLPDDSLAAAPRPTPAARVTRRPFRLHRVKKRPPPPR
jgi:hypothetical protein